MVARGLDIPEVDLVIQCEPPKVRIERWREREGGREGGRGREGERKRREGGRSEGREREMEGG